MPSAISGAQARRFGMRALLGYALVIVTVAGPALIAFGFVYAAADARDHVTTEYESYAALAEHLRRDGVSMSASVRGYLLTGRSEYLDALATSRFDFGRTVDQLRLHTNTAKGEQILAEVTQAATAYSDSVDHLVQHAMQGGVEHEMSRAALGRAFEADVASLSMALDSALDAYVANRYEQVEPAKAHAQAAFRRSIALGVMGIAVAICLSVYLAARASKDLRSLYVQERDSSERATKALAARQEILGIVAHDLRSPLSAIALKASIIRKTTAETTTRKHAEGIERITSRMTDLIGMLLDAFAAESGHLPVKPIRLEVEDVTHDVMEIFAGQAESKHLRLSCTIDSPDLAVTADRNRVVQTLSNLIGNALKFTPEGGAIMLAARPDNTEVLFSVSDTGPGIDRANLAHVFERFWKADADGKRGTGLGLFIAKAIVEAHAGRIWVESTEGKGTTFFFTLPCAPHTDRPLLRPSEQPHLST